MTTHSRTLAWRISWMEEPSGLQSMGLQRVGHNWATSLSLSSSLVVRPQSNRTMWPQRRILFQVKVFELQNLSRTLESLFPTFFFFFFCYNLCIYLSGINVVFLETFNLKKIFHLSSILERKWSAFFICIRKFSKEILFSKLMLSKIPYSR